MAASDFPIRAGFHKAFKGRGSRRECVLTMWLAPPITESWQPRRLQPDKFNALLALTQDLAGPLTRRNDDALCAVVEHGSTITQALFGLNSLQWFYRKMRRRELWAVDRGSRNGVWWCEARDLPLFMIPRRRSLHHCGRVSAEWQWMVEPLLAHEEPDWSVVDLGPDRLPAVWVCNLCGRTAVWEEWPKRFVPGLSGSDYIYSCSDCGAKRDDNSVQVLVDGMSDKGFNPTMQMQDDLFFTMS